MSRRSSEVIVAARSPARGAMSVFMLCMAAVAILGNSSATRQKTSPMATTAVQGQKWGVQTYMVTVSGTGTATVTTAATLIDASGSRVGEYIRRRHYRQAADGTISNALGLMHLEVVRLTWQMDVFEIETETDEGIFKFTLNGRSLGEITVRSDARDPAPEIGKLIAERRELVDITAAIGDDLEQMTR